MPCFDGRAFEEDERIYQEHKQYKAILCALLNEIGDDLELIKRAEKRGMVDIRGFVQEHTVEDKKRLKKQIQSLFSKHELALIKEMLVWEEDSNE